VRNLAKRVAALEAKIADHSIKWRTVAVEQFPEDCDEFYREMKDAAIAADKEANGAFDGDYIIMTWVSTYTRDGEWVGSRRSARALELQAQKKPGVGRYA
jgi:hypothetical protein